MQFLSHIPLDSLPPMPVINQNDNIKYPDSINNNNININPANAANNTASKSIISPSDNPLTPTLIRVLSPSIISAIESLIKVEWHYDEAYGGMESAFHSILQFQIKKNSNKKSTTSDGKRKRSADNSTQNYSTPTPTHRNIFDYTDINKRILTITSHNQIDQRIQSLIHDNDLLARATIMIENSAKYFHELCTYYKIFIVEQQTEYEWITENKSPVWLYRFELNQLNSRLRKLKQIETKNYFGIEQNELQLLQKWRSTITNSQFQLLPDQFALLLANYNSEEGPALYSDCLQYYNRVHNIDNADSMPSNTTLPPHIGSLLLFPIHTFHAVLGAEQSKLIRLKIYLGVYRAYPHSIDTSGFASAHGSNRPEMRQFEAQKMQNKLNEIKVDKEGLELFGFDEKNNLFSGDNNDCVWNRGILRVGFGQEKENHQKKQIEIMMHDLNEYGACLLPAVIPSNFHTVPRIFHYISQLMDFPNNFHLFDPKHAAALHEPKLRKQYGLETKHLRRIPDDAKTTIIQASHGNMAIGAFCRPAIEVALYLAPIIKSLYKQWKWPPEQLLPRNSNEQKENVTQFNRDHKPILYTLEIALQNPLPSISYHNTTQPTTPSIPVMNMDTEFSFERMSSETASFHSHHKKQFLNGTGM